MVVLLLSSLRSASALVAPRLVRPRCSTKTKTLRSLSSTPLSCTVHRHHPVIATAAMQSPVLTPKPESSVWSTLPVSPSELCIATTLKCGQSFRWKYNEVEDSYSCSLSGRVVQLKQRQGLLMYRAIWPDSNSLTTPRHQGKAVYKQLKPTTGKRKRTAGAQEPLTPPSSMKASASPTPRTTPAPATSMPNDDTRALIEHYLNLNPNLSDLYAQWSESDKNFAKKAPRFTGIRILRQDAWEALVCFICSSNNNIARIGQMVDKLCAEYGQLIAEVDWPSAKIEDTSDMDSDSNDGGHSGIEQLTKPFYSFPKPEDLVGRNVEGRLRELGFGYRARYIAETANIVCDRGGMKWVDSLRNPEYPSYASELKPCNSGKMAPEGRPGYRTAHEALLELQGVGPKVADCVCLMGLAWGEAVPVDTHVWQIAQRDYKFGKGKNTSMTKATYDAVANHFRNLWGVEAGWAHSVLFTADLRVFAERLTAKIEVKEKIEEQMETRVVKKEVKRVMVKTEVDDDDLKKIKIDEVALTMTSSERVKRRRGGR